MHRTRNTLTLIAGTCLLALSTATTALAYDAFKPITGTVERIVDVDTLDIAGVRISVRGLDAPEMRDPGGSQATQALRAIVGDHVVTCKPDGTKTHKRTVAICTIDGTGEDIARELVRQGYALDCAHFSGGTYAPFETEAAIATIAARPTAQDERRPMSTIDTNAHPLSQWHGRTSTAVIRSDGRRFYSMGEAARQTPRSDAEGIALVCRGKRKTCGRHGWRFETNKESQA